MKNLKRVLSLVLALMMALSLMAFSSSASAAGSTSFTVASQLKGYDNVAEENQEAVDVVVALDVIRGDTGDGTGEPDINPNGNLKRAEAAVILARLVLGVEVTDGLPEVPTAYSDITADYLYATGAIQTCTRMELIAGNGDGTFEPAGTLTYAAFGKMLLGALGYNSEIEGYANVGELWVSNVAMGLTRAGINLSGVGLEDTLTRQQAMQMVFKALQAKTVTYDTNSKVFKYVEVEVAKDSGNIAADGYVQLAEKNFSNLALATGGEDDFGRPVNKWTLNGKTVVETTSSTPVLTYTEPVTEKQLFADLGAPGIKGVYDYYVTMDKVWYNGVEVTDKSPWSENVTIAKNDGISTVMGCGNGATIEIYDNGETNHYIMVIVDEYVAELNKANIHAATATTGAYVTINAPRVNDDPAATNYTTDEFQAGDVVLYTMANSQIVSMKLAEVVENVTVQSYKGSVVTTSAGEFDSNHTFAALTGWSTSDLGKAYDLYLDSCGNVIHKVPHSESPVEVGNFAYILDAQGEAPSGGSIIGRDYTLKVRAVLADGTVDVYDVPVTKVTTANKVGSATVSGAKVGNYYVTGANVLVYDAEAAEASRDKAGDNLENKVFGYTLNGTEMKLSAVTGTSSITADDVGKKFVNALGDKYTSGNTINAGNSVTALINASTVFVVINDNGADSKADVYTGGITIKNGTNGLTTTNSWVVMTAANTSTGVANVVFTTDKNNVNGNNESTTTAGYAYVDKTTRSVSGTANKIVYTYTGIAADSSEITLTSSKEITTSGVYGYSDRNEIEGDLLTAMLTTVVGDMISTNDGWLPLTNTQYVYINGMGEANGNLCVVIPGAGNKSAAVVFVVAAPAAITNDDGNVEASGEAAIAPGGLETVINEIKNGAEVKAEADAIVTVATLTGTVTAASGATVNAGSLAATGKIVVPANTTGVEVNLTGTANSGATIEVKAGANVSITVPDEVVGSAETLIQVADGATVTINGEAFKKVTIGTVSVQALALTRDTVAPTTITINGDFSNELTVSSNSSANITINGDLAKDAKVTVNPEDKVIVTGDIKAAVTVTSTGVSDWHDLSKPGTGVGLRAPSADVGDYVKPETWGSLLVRWSNDATETLTDKYYTAAANSASAKAGVILTIKDGTTVVYQELGYTGLNLIGTKELNSDGWHYRAEAGALTAGKTYTIEVNELNTPMDIDVGLETTEPEISALSDSGTAVSASEMGTLLASFTYTMPSAS